MQGDLKRIANRTKGEIALEDLENEAYLLLEEFIKVHNREPYLWDSQDRGWVASRLHNKFVKWADHKFKYALRIDLLEDEEGESWVLDLPAPADSNPLVEILFQEELLAHQSFLESSYSEAKAYVVTFDNFNHNKEILSNYFYITSDTLGKRFSRAIVVLEHQPSLFDFIETIDESFSPIPGREKARASIHSEKVQLALHF